jgi:outer membrane protein OmpA-like peptidoglycan-associated protein
LARAVVVAERLRAAGIHAGTVFVATAGEADPPYANDTVENRRRNRTVTIRVYERSPEKAGQP